MAVVSSEGACLYSSRSQSHVHTYWQEVDEKEMIRFTSCKRNTICREFGLRLRVKVKRGRREVQDSFTPGLVQSFRLFSLNLNVSSYRRCWKSFLAVNLEEEEQRIVGNETTQKKDNK
ncbi:unnamed protein product [Pleuronectes platessa]|uniref:Uncharacterized protein n=1 Tax=Pleuronectes platessa TaxID=8262 RepID=A0A9N7UV27_PLEPL|nr:unnamed protein product [Pleuronectes platessa]